MNKKRVVITGMGVLSPIGIGKREFADSLEKANPEQNPITAFDASNFSTKFCANVKNFCARKFY
jgi:3-oxoacyl-[acyl-carrier-protein] synthase II